MPKGAHLRTHGLSKHPLYGRWRGMVQRCTDPRHKNYATYGGRGITVCDRWLSFPTFLADMGMPSRGESLERKDGSASYSPENCIWATQQQQMRNTTATRLLTFRGETKCLQDWAEVAGVEQSTMRYRLANWPLERALTEPKHPKGVNQ